MSVQQADLEKFGLLMSPSAGIEFEDDEKCTRWRLIIT